jgi:hypothetical protein
LSHVVKTHIHRGNAMKTAGWAKLLEDEDVRRWHENLARGSAATAVERARVLYRFLRVQGLTPASLVELAKQDRHTVEDLLSDFVGGLLRQGISPGYVENYLKAERSWLEYNEIRLVRKRARHRTIGVSEALVEPAHFTRLHDFLQRMTTISVAIIKDLRGYRCLFTLSAALSAT